MDVTWPNFLSSEFGTKAYPNFWRYPAVPETQCGISHGKPRNRFDTIPACDRQTDQRTEDRQLIPALSHRRAVKHFATAINAGDTCTVRH